MIERRGFVDEKQRQRQRQAGVAQDSREKGSLTVTRDIAVIHHQPDNPFTALLSVCWRRLLHSNC